MQRETVSCKNGFTLIETIIYVAIIGIVMSSFVAFGLSISFSRSKTYAIQEVQANARMLMDTIVQKIRHAQSVTSPGIGLENESMVLDMPGSEPDVAFSLVEGRVFLAEGAGDDLAIVSSRVAVENLKFTNIATIGGTESIMVDFDMRYRNAASVEYSYFDSFHSAVTNRY